MKILSKCVVMDILVVKNYNNLILFVIMINFMNKINNIV